MAVTIRVHICRERSVFAQEWTSDYEDGKSRVVESRRNEVRAMNFVFRRLKRSDDGTSRLVRLRRRLAREFPDLRTTERRRFVMSAPLARMVMDERKCTTIR